MLKAMGTRFTGAAYNFSMYYSRTTPILSPCCLDHIPIVQRSLQERTQGAPSHEAASLFVRTISAFPLSWSVAGSWSSSVVCVCSNATSQTKTNRRHRNAYTVPPSYQLPLSPLPPCSLVRSTGENVLQLRSLLSLGEVCLICMTRGVKISSFFRVIGYFYGETTTTARPSRSKAAKLQPFQFTA